MQTFIMHLLKTSPDNKGMITNVTNKTAFVRISSGCAFRSDLLKIDYLLTLVVVKHSIG